LIENFLKWCVFMQIPLKGELNILKKFYDNTKAISSVNMANN
jgi:hypothetical protein